MKRLDALFSPERLNKNWSSESEYKSAVNEEQTESENSLESLTLLQMWATCQQSFVNDLKKNDACAQLIENIGNQLRYISENGPVTDEKLNRITKNILLLERLCETQLLTQRKNY